MVSLKAVCLLGFRDSWLHMGFRAPLTVTVHSDQRALGVCKHQSHLSPEDNLPQSWKGFHLEGTLLSEALHNTRQESGGASTYSADMLGSGELLLPSIMSLRMKAVSGMRSATNDLKKAHSSVGSSI